MKLEVKLPLSHKFIYVDGIWHLLKFDEYLGGVIRNQGSFQPRMATKKDPFVLYVMKRMIELKARGVNLGLGLQTILDIVGPEWDVSFNHALFIGLASSGQPNYIIVMPSIISNRRWDQNSDIHFWEELIRKLSRWQPPLLLLLMGLQEMRNERQADEIGEQKKQYWTTGTLDLFFELCSFLPGHTSCVCSG